jgi:hypothetical protein
MFIIMQNSKSNSENRQKLQVLCNSNYKFNKYNIDSDTDESDDELKYKELGIINPEENYYNTVEEDFNSEKDNKNQIFCNNYYSEALEMLNQSREKTNEFILPKVYVNTNIIRKEVNKKESKELSIEKKVKYYNKVNKKLKLIYEQDLNNSINEIQNTYYKLYNELSRNIETKYKKIDKLKDNLCNCQVEINKLFLEANQQKLDLEQKKDKLDLLVKEKKKEIDDLELDKKEFEKYKKESIDDMTKRTSELEVLEKKILTCGKNKFIRINVGGEIFETLESTLTNSSDYFKCLLNGKFNKLVDEDNIIFIDRNPEYFKLILERLKNPTLDIKKFRKINDIISYKNNYDYYLFLADVDYYLLNHLF